MKKIIFLFLFSFASFAFAANNSELTSDKNELNINETFTVQAKLEFEGDLQATFKDLKLNDNFELLESSSFNSSDNNIEIINGKTNQISKNKILINMILRAKKVGNLEIGPAEFELNGEKILTNNLKIKVNAANTSKTNTKTNQNNNYDKIIYYLIGITILVLALNYIAIAKIKENKKNNEDEKELKINKKKEIIFPSVNDNNFEDNLYLIFLELLDDKYCINGIYSKTTQEILDYVDKENKSKIEEILKLFDILKYSPSKEGKEILLLKVQDLHKEFN